MAPSSASNQSLLLTMSAVTRRATTPAIAPKVPRAIVSGRRCALHLAFDDRGDPEDVDAPAWQGGDDLPLYRRHPRRAFPQSQPVNGQGRSFLQVTREGGGGEDIGRKAVDVIAHDLVREDHEAHQLDAESPGWVWCAEGPASPFSIWASVKAPKGIVSPSFQPSSLAASAVAAISSALRRVWHRSRL